MFVMQSLPFPKLKELRWKKKKSGDETSRMNQVIGKETVNLDLLRNFIG
jgi:hypothetical protein